MFCAGCFFLYENNYKYILQTYVLCYKMEMRE
jgi:hypothetical protein